MKQLLDAFWRAGAYCLHPRVIALSILPLLIGAGITLGLGYYLWEPAVAAVRALLESWSLIETGLKLVESWFGPSFRAMLAPLVIVLVAAPLIVVLSVLLVALLMTPSIVTLVSARRFPTLEKLHGGGWFGSLGWSLGCTVVSLLALVVSLPLWFIPPLVLVVPPLIWGWLTFQVMSFDVLAEHASRDERRQLLREHRLPLLTIGIVSGYLGAAPSLLWAFGAATLIFAPVLIAVSVWLYTLVFGFSALWFAHYALAALATLRQATAGAAAGAALANQARRGSGGAGEVVDVPGALPHHGSPGLPTLPSRHDGPAPPPATPPATPPAALPPPI